MWRSMGPLEVATSSSDFFQSMSPVSPAGGGPSRKSSGSRRARESRRRSNPNNNNMPCDDVIADGSSRRLGLSSGGGSSAAYTGSVGYHRGSIVDGVTRSRRRPSAPTTFGFDAYAKPPATPQNRYGNESGTGGGRRSRRSSRDLNRIDGSGSRECSYSRGSSIEPPPPTVIENGRRSAPRSSSSSITASHSKANSPARDFVNSTDRRLVTSFSQSDLSRSHSAGRMRYERDFLLQLQYAPECLHKPAGLPQLPEIILNQPTLRQNQTLHGCSAVVTSPRSNPNGPNLLPRRSLSEVNPALNRSLSGGSVGNGGSSSRSGRRGAQPSPAQSSGTRKVIQVALQQPVQLHTAENAWKPNALKLDPLSPMKSDQIDSEELYRKLRGILNKLTPQKFDSLRDKVLALPIDSEARLKGCINIIFEKAIDEPQFSVSYANLAKNMMNLKVPAEQNLSEFVSFRKLLLNQCQQEFEKDKQDETDMQRRQLAIDCCLAEDVKKHLIEEKEQAEWKSRRRSLGNIRFIGELFKLKMLTEGIMRDCVLKLLKDCDEDSLECLCRLLTTIGKDLEEKAGEYVRQYFQAINRIIRGSGVSNRIRFMLQDVVDLRNNDWVPRREDNKPKTIDQIHLEAEQQKSATLLRVQSTPTMLDQRFRHRNSVDNWKSPSSSIDAGKIRLTRQPVDDNIQLGPGSGRQNYAQWQIGSSGGSNGVSRPPSADREQQARLLQEVKASSDAFYSMLTRGSREMARESKVRERSAALEAVRNMMGGQPLPRVPSAEGVRMTLSSGPTSSSSTTTTTSATNGLSVLSAAETAPVMIPAERRAEFVRKLKSILKELMEIKDFKEAVNCVCDLNCSTYMSEVVVQTVNDVLEWSDESRRLCGQLHWHLINSRLLTVEQYVVGLKDVLATVEDMEIDIPKIWHYLAEVISPLIQLQPIVPMAFLDSAFEPLLPNPRVADVIVYVVKDAANRLGRPIVTQMWIESGLDWSKFVVDANVDAFLEKNDLKWVKFEPAPSVVKAVAANGVHAGVDQFTQKFQRLISNDGAVSNGINALVKDLEDAAGSDSLQLTGALTTAIGTCCLKGDELKGYTVDSDLLKKLAPLLGKYVAHVTERELQVLHVLEELVHQRQHPANVLSTLFEVLSIEDVICEDSFDQWYEGKTKLEYPGKGVARASTAQFFQWLHNSNVSDDS